MPQAIGAKHGAPDRQVVALAAEPLKVGDHVAWNSEAGRVYGMITRVVTSPTVFKGYTVHATQDEPQYEIKSDTTEHIAMHRAAALRKLRT
jgi:hypothetical protein